MTTFTAKNTPHVDDSSSKLGDHTRLYPMMFLTDEELIDYTMSSLFAPDVFSLPKMDSGTAASFDLSCECLPVSETKLTPFAVQNAPYADDMSFTLGDHERFYSMPLLRSTDVSRTVASETSIMWANPTTRKHKIESLASTNDPPKKQPRIEKLARTRVKKHLPAELLIKAKTEAETTRLTKEKAATAEVERSVERVTTFVIDKADVDSDAQVGNPTSQQMFFSFSLL